MSRYIHNHFNDARMNASRAQEHLKLLAQSFANDIDHADPNAYMEVKDLITDTETLMRRIDRLHHDFAANTEIDEPTIYS